MFYKIVKRTEDGLLESPFTQIDELKLMYTPNMRTYPTVGLVFVFKTREKVSIILDTFDDSNLEIWECEVKNPVSLSLVLDLCSGMSEDIKHQDIFRYWICIIDQSSIVNPKDFNSSLVYADDTYACEWVELTRRVY